MRNGSIVHGESTFKPRLTSLNEGKPYNVCMYVYIYFFLFVSLISYSRRRAKAGILNVRFDKTNEKLNEAHHAYSSTPLPLVSSRDRSNYGRLNERSTFQRFNPSRRVYSLDLLYVFPVVPIMPTQRNRALGVTDDR